MDVQMNLFEIDTKPECKPIKIGDNVSISKNAIAYAQTMDDFESYYYLSDFLGEVGEVIKKHYGTKPYVEVDFKSKVGLFYMNEVSVILD